MRSPGFSEESIHAALSIVNQEKCAPPLPEDEVRRIARSLACCEPSDLRWLPPYATGEVGILLSTVVPEEVDWVWTGRIPKGKLTIIDGDYFAAVSLPLAHATLETHPCICRRGTVMRLPSYEQP